MSKMNEQNNAVRPELPLFTFPLRQSSPVQQRPPSMVMPSRKRMRRISSADSVFLSSSNSEHIDDHRSSKPRKKHHVYSITSSSSDTDAHSSWTEPAIPSTRDNLQLRPSKAQRDFLRKRQGYHGFYYLQPFDTGVEPYGYPDKELPPFRDGQMLDRMAWSDWVRRQRNEKLSPKGKKKVEDVVVSVEGGGKAEGGRRRTRGEVVGLRDQPCIVDPEVGLGLAMDARRDSRL